MKGNLILKNDKGNIHLWGTDELENTKYEQKYKYGVYEINKDNTILLQDKKIELTINYEDRYLEGILKCIQVGKCFILGSYGNVTEYKALSDPKVNTENNTIKVEVEMVKVK